MAGPRVPLRPGRSRVLACTASSEVADAKSAPSRSIVARHGSASPRRPPGRRDGFARRSTVAADVLEPHRTVGAAPAALGCGTRRRDRRHPRARSLGSGFALGALHAIGRIAPQTSSGARAAARRARRRVRARRPRGRVGRAGRRGRRSGGRRAHGIARRPGGVRADASAPRSRRARGSRRRRSAPRTPGLFALVMAIHHRSGGNVAAPPGGGRHHDPPPDRGPSRAPRADRAGRISGAVLGVLPVAFFLVLAATSHRELAPVYRSPAGAAMIIGGLVLEGLAYLWIRHLLKVEA